MAGVDAVIVQDMGLARLIRAISPDIEIHASTQMSITSEEGVELARELGCSRVILARELSLDEIGRIRRGSDLPLEVFVHGALCVAYSGQCLTSEALGGRSANRGECAQACRMPYQIVCDGRLVDLENVQYLLSPQDLAAYDLIPRLIDLGVASLKIEGRLKTAEYVANITRHYRDGHRRGLGRPADRVHAARRPRRCSSRSRAGSPTGSSTATTTRSWSGATMPRSGGFSWASWNRSRRPACASTWRRRSSPATAWSSMATNRSAATNRAAGSSRSSRSDAGRRTLRGPVRGDRILGPGRAAVRARVDRPAPARRRPAGLEDRRSRADAPAPPIVRRAAEPQGRPGHRGRRHRRRAAPRSPDGRRPDMPRRSNRTEPLARAESRAADESLFTAQLGRLGGTIYRLGRVEPTIEGRPMVPMSLLNRSAPRSRRAAGCEATAPPTRTIPGRSCPCSASIADVACQRSSGASNRPDPGRAVGPLPADRPDRGGRLAGHRDDLRRLPGHQAVREAVAAARRGNAAIYLATPRIEKPGEGNSSAILARQGADGILVRNAGGMQLLRERGIPFVADFSMNAANPLTVELLKTGARRG